MEAPFPWQQRLHVALGRDARDESCALGHRLTDTYQLERNTKACCQIGEMKLMHEHKMHTYNVHINK